ncbi:hypothetical protein GCM10020221_32850 [Streptomyces thioluteus]|uniref:LysR family transcriptional regulator n=1 Tax=Streptomyces thioluteus TaxID=66431 RepID=A0ABP6JJH6_STRTU
MGRARCVRPHGRTLSLTAAGRTFLAAVERALADVDRAAELRTRRRGPRRRQDRFGLPAHDGSETVPELIRAFRA